MYLPSKKAGVFSSDTDGLRERAQNMIDGYRGFNLLDLLTLCVAEYLQLPLARLAFPFPGIDLVLQGVMLHYRGSAVVDCPVVI